MSNPFDLNNDLPTDDIADNLDGYATYLQRTKGYIAELKAKDHLDETETRMLDNHRQVEMTLEGLIELQKGKAH